MTRLVGLLRQILVNDYHLRQVPLIQSTKVSYSRKQSTKVSYSRKQSTKVLNCLNHLQHAVVVGGLLGDLHIQRTTASTQRCRLRVCHSVAQREYVDWKYRVLMEPFCEGVKPPHETARAGEYMFYTKYRDEFLSYRDEWYKDDGNRFRKRVPDTIDTMLVDPISLAVWYLDDGTKRNDSDACRLATQGFSLQEN